MSARIASQLQKNVSAPRGVTAVTPEILLYLCNHSRPDEIEQYQQLVGDWNPITAAAWFWNQGGVRVALVDGAGKPIAALGWYASEPGIYQPWMVGTQEGWDMDWRQIHRMARWLTEQVVANRAGIRRMQMMALASRKGALAWYERMGLEREAVLRRYAKDGGDVVLHARIFEPDEA